MRILAINTVGQACEAGIWEGDRCLSHVKEPMRNGHDTRLPLITKQAVLEAGLDFDKIQRIAAVAGPGSFTGVRVGVAFARGLGVALNVTVAGISSLEASLPDETQGRVLVALPARRREPDLSWWAQMFVDGERAGEPVEADITQMRGLVGEADHVFGDGLAVLKDVEYEEAFPKLSRAAKWAVSISNNERANPQYVREPDAVPMKLSVSNENT